ncbi:MAG: DNA repair protein RecO [Nannocystaceae bacterium]
MSTDGLLTPAIVLRTRPLREADLVVVLLTRSRGRLDALAYGARRSRRRFPGGLSIGARGEATLASERRGMYRLEGFSPGCDHSVVGRDLERFAYVAYICELCEALIVGTETDTSLYDRVDRAVRESVEGTVRPAILRRYELSLLHALGFLPFLDDCAVCSAPVPCAAGEGVREVFFDGRAGGVRCAEHRAGAGTVAEAVLAVARELLRDPCADPLETLSPVHRRDLRDLCLGLLRAHLVRPLRSLGFFASLSAVTKPRPHDPHS